MKTPREVLMQQHRSAQPKLDVIRQSAVAAVCNRPTATNPADKRRRPSIANTAILRTLWHELVRPCRGVWTGLAVVWILIFAVNLSLRDRSPADARKASAPETTMALKDQQRILAELLSDRPISADADRQKIFSPKPRTERIELTTT